MLANVIDIKDDDRYRSEEDRQRRALVDLGGARTYSSSPSKKTTSCLRRFRYIGKKLACSPISRSHYCRTSRRRRSSLWRTHGC